MLSTVFEAFSSLNPEWIGEKKGSKMTKAKPTSFVVRFREFSWRFRLEAFAGAFDRFRGVFLSAFLGFSSAFLCRFRAVFGLVEVCS